MLPRHRAAALLRAPPPPAYALSALSASGCGGGYAGGGWQWRQHRGMRRGGWPKAPALAPARFGGGWLAYLKMARRMAGG